ncbi:hypothetical protein N7530_004697 [Penicillium desertorum]|uniref:Uncharacterized protein n=1 Tax=Penicillium desertorum TaxID=1303715 RepID=A0A9W9WYP5_9EURO|nr:hypothetical protein N7530_004697 [Penicillium desertorum]
MVQIADYVRIEEGNAQGCMLYGIRVDSALVIRLHAQSCIQQDPGTLSKKWIQRGVGVCIINLCLSATCNLKMRSQCSLT